jgi:hypothetical protein
MNVASPLSPEVAHSLRVAPMATLDATARSESAKRLMAHLADELINWETAFADRKNQRKGRLDKLQKAIGAFLADLLSARPPRSGWLDMAFTAQGRLFGTSGFLP